jgi:hypothetical protein
MAKAKAPGTTGKGRASVPKVARKRNRTGASAAGPATPTASRAPRTKDPAKVAAGKASAAARAARAEENGQKLGKTPGSGRGKGVPNRRTVEVVQLVDSVAAAPGLADAPFMLWALVLHEGMKPKGQQARQFLVGHTDKGLEIWSRPTLGLMMLAADKLAPYLAPRRKAVDVSDVDVGDPYTFNFQEDYSQLGLAPAPPPRRPPPEERGPPPRTDRAMQAPRLPAPDRTPQTAPATVGAGFVIPQV